MKHKCQYRQHDEAHPICGRNCEKEKKGDAASGASPDAGDPLGILRTD